MTRIEAGRIELSDEEFNPASVVRAAVNLIGPKADEKGLEMQVELPDSEIADVIGDPGRFKQIVLNLLTNAIKFTKKGKVRVALASRTAGNSEEIVLTVVDTGIGISLEDQTRIFDRFTQADSSTTRKAEGCGLGLAICKALVDAMKGKIQLTSTPGEGTRVRVSFKLRHAGSDAGAMRSLA
jgi:signal transduction histidine kinase